MTCLGVLSTVSHLRTFSLDCLLLAREASSGISIGAYFISQNVIDLIWVLMAPALFLGPYCYLTLPVGTAALFQPAGRNTICPPRPHPPAADYSCL